LCLMSVCSYPEETISEVLSTLALVNYPQFWRQRRPVNGMASCVMCGCSCICVQKRDSTTESKRVIVIRHRGICASCCVKVWVVVNSGLHIKWCHACKHFLFWSAFGDSRTGTKCTNCRHRSRESKARTKKGGRDVSKAVTTAKKVPRKAIAHTPVSKKRCIPLLEYQFEYLR